MKSLSLKAFLPLALFAILIVGFFVGTRLNPQQLSSELIGKPVPAFELPSLYEDQPVVTEEALKGKVTLINVFGSWCVTCIVEHPYLMELKASEDIQMLGVDWRDTREDGQTWLNKRGNPYDVIAFDEHSALVIELGVSKAPETFLVGPDGIILAKHSGAVDEQVWRKTFLPEIGKLELSK